MRNYRGKTKDGKWVEGCYCKVSGKHLIVQSNAKLVDPTGGLVINVFPKYYIDGWFEVIPETVSQSTGLHDKNGKEIYEGDNLRHYGKNPHPSGHIVFCDGGFWADWVGAKISPTEKLYQRLTRHFEIIGNIHTTPEKENG